MPKILTLTIISNHLEILTRRKSAEERLFYILYTHREHLKYKELQRVIANDAYGSLVGGDKTNLSRVLKEQYPDSPLQLRDTIYIDLLGLPQKFKETRLRKAMVDRDVKRSNENPSIGILLCREADSLQVEYALSRSMSPTMVAEYQRLLIPKEVLQAQIEEYAQIALGDTKDESSH